jgi:hypothetical protein
MIQRLRQAVVAGVFTHRRLGHHDVRMVEAVQDRREGLVESGHVLGQGQEGVFNCHGVDLFEELKRRT